jgi:hypothetical protein
MPPRVCVVGVRMTAAESEQLIALCQRWCACMFRFFDPGCKALLNTITLL